MKAGMTEPGNADKGIIADAGHEAGNRAPGGGARSFAVRRAPSQSKKHLLLRAGITISVLALLAWGVFWLRTSDTFSIVRVETGSYRFTSEGELETILSGFLGRNIWTLSNTEMEGAMAHLPWVRDLRLRRRLPAVIEVDFREWRPLLEVAGVAGGKKGRAVGEDPSWVLVEDGRVLPFPEHLVLAGLPVLTGVQCVPGGGDGSLNLDPAETDLVLALLMAMEESGLESVSPVDFVVARPEGFGIILQDDLGSLLIGREDFSNRLNRYMEAHEYLDKGLILDLRFKDRVTCRRPDPEFSYLRPEGIADRGLLAALASFREGNTRDKEPTWAREG